MIVRFSVRPFYILTLSLFIVLTFSCSKSNDSKLSGENNVIKISGTLPKTLKLTGRVLDDWKLSMGNYYYSYQIVDSSITGKTLGEGYNYMFPASILFAPKDWRNGLGEAPVVKSLPLSEPIFKNQEKIDSLIWSDILYASYDGPKESEIQGLRFVHANALLDFRMEGFPERAVVKISPSPIGEYSPYRYNENSYQYIMMGSWWKPSDSIKQYIIVYINEQRYSIEVEMNKNNIFYEFVLKYDNIQERISIDNLRESVWSNRNWPEN